MKRLPNSLALGALLAALCVQGCTNDDVSDGLADASGTQETSGSGSESGDGDGDESSEDGDLPPEEDRPELRSPAEAEDLDPSAEVVRVELTAAPYEYEVAGELVQGWAYNQQVPGPTIRLQRGQTLEVAFHNGLDADTTVHWHGLHVPFEMDGVTWQGAPVEPGQDFEYSFQIDQAGTYWYHPHVDTDRQVDLGLYGVIVVEDPAEPPADRELIVVFDAWDEYSFDSENEGTNHGLDGGELAWTSNGLLDPVFPASAGESIRVRSVNVANTGYVELAYPQMRQIASDQGLLPELREPESIVLAPSDRADTELLISEGFEVLSRPHSLLGPGVGPDIPLFDVVVDEPGSAPAPLEFPFDGSEPTADPGWTDVLYAFHGDPHTGNWTINGELFPDITIASLPRDSWSVVELRNISQTAHPFHLHGHAFEVLSVDGVAPVFRVVEDSFDVSPYSIVRLGLMPDNVGDWMAHCHILPHVDGGMMTVLRVDP